MAVSIIVTVLPLSARVFHACSAIQYEEFVEQTLSIVELDTIRDSMVGMPGVAGLSGE